jgi:agmatine deiminase
MIQNKIVILLIASIILLGGCANFSTSKVEPLNETPQYLFPHEGIEHEGTWLQWPHDNLYKDVITYYEPIWIEMTRGLIKGENVHLIVFDESEKKRVIKVLEKENIDMTRIDFFIFPTDDVWIRDNGPIFVYDEDGNLVIENWKFNGWGNKAPYEKDTQIPSQISTATGISKIDIPMVMEGGALEIDGNGTLMSTLSCINNNNRTADFSLEEIESYLTKYYGVKNFIWLDGVAGMDITDNHIDGMMKFYDDKLIIADSIFNLDPSTLEDGDEKTLLTAKNTNGEPYEFVFLPSTKENVVQVEGEWIKGAYTNFYVANAVILVPNYNDENDQVANKILQDLYPDKEVVGIDVRDLYVDGGMIHCVTQQQPIAINPNSLD